MKRLFDILLSLAGLLVLAPLFAAVALFIKLDSRGPVFFRQERVGRHFRPFAIYKFRTMTEGAEKEGALITIRGDKRITRVGHFLRNYKIDELPQLFNVLRGDMSLVGPRPEVREYVQLFRADYEKLLAMRPGITDPASLRYSDEESALASADNWQDDYLKRILPEKIRLSLRYLDDRNFLTDLALILQTIFKVTDVRRLMRRIGLL
jgi:lipopolysaccharide/colanic/teichoic acid biosynthesis glycosyltransferase